MPSLGATYDPFPLLDLLWCFLLSALCPLPCLILCLLPCAPCYIWCSLFAPYPIFPVLPVLSPHPHLHLAFAAHKASYATCGMLWVVHPCSTGFPNSCFLCIWLESVTDKWDFFSVRFILFFGLLFWGLSEAVFLREDCKKEGVFSWTRWRN